MKIRKIKDEVYNRTVYIGCNESYDVFKKEMWNQHGVKVTADPCDKLTDAMCVPLEKAFAIWLEKDSLPVLIHEFMHLTQRILEEKGIYLSRATSEVYAYYIEWLVKKSSN